MREARSFTISKDILSEIARTKGNASTSERVNTLLRRALDLERQEQLELEAEEFFAGQSENSLRERAAYLKAARQTLARE
jgi:hypothetical protein